MNRCLTRFTLAFTLASSALFGQSDNSVLQGSVRDSQGKPVAAATVQLRATGQTLTAVTDVRGNYRFRELRAGSYSLRASESRFGKADFGPFLLGRQETKKVDLTLDSPATAQFFRPAYVHRCGRH